MVHPLRLGYAARMKYRQCNSLFLMVPLAVFTSFSVSCSRSSDTAETQSASTVDQQIDKAESAASKAIQDLDAYTYARKNEFVADMERQLSDLNSNLEELGANIAKAGPAIRAEAEPKLATLRAKADLLTKQLDNVKDATSSTWDIVKDTSSKAYDELNEDFTQARQWLSEKIAP